MIPPYTTPIKNEILIEIFAKGKLTRMEMRIVSYVMRWSWGFDKGKRRQDWTKSITEKQIAEDLGVHKVVICRTIKQMIRRKILLTEKLTKGLCYQFNEHYKDWKKLTKMLTNKKLTEKLTKVNQNVNKRLTEKLICDAAKQEPESDIETLKETKETIKKIVAFLNLTANRSFKYQSTKTQNSIKARLNEGFVLDNFKLVIEDRAEKWQNDGHMKQYLRPETLFGTKMEGYLEEAKDNKKQLEEIIA